LICWRIVIIQKLKADRFWGHNYGSFTREQQETCSADGNYSKVYTRHSAIADRPRNALTGQSRSPNMVPFHVMVFY